MTKKKFEHHEETHPVDYQQEQVYVDKLKLKHS